MPFLGEFAAIGASIAFSITATLFTLSGRHYGAQLTMMGSLPIGLACLMLVHWLAIGTVLPIDANPLRWIYLGLSGIIGFWLTAVSMMNAFLRIGPRLTLLIAALGPIISTIFAWILLDEQLPAMTIVGIIVTIGGITFVITENDKSNDTQKATSASAFRTGIIFALSAAIGQAISFILSKQGLTGDFTPIYDYIGLFPIELDLYHHALNAFDPLSGSVIRILFGAVSIWMFTAIRGQVRTNIQTLLSHRIALRQLSVAAISGPVIGASLLLFALAIAPIGIATTLANLTPIFLIPIGFIVFKERISPRAIIGTAIAISGIAVLFI